MCKGELCNAIAECRSILNNNNSNNDFFFIVIRLLLLLILLFINHGLRGLRNRQCITIILQMLLSWFMVKAYISIASIDKGFHVAVLMRGLPHTNRRQDERQRAALSLIRILLNVLKICLQEGWVKVAEMTPGSRLSRKRLSPKSSVGQATASGSMCEWGSDLYQWPAAGDVPWILHRMSSYTK